MRNSAKTAACLREQAVSRSRIRLSRAEEQKADLLPAAGVGAVLYFTGDDYQINRNLRLAGDCYVSGEYEEALFYYEEALQVDRSLAEAYLGSADVYLEEAGYQDAAKILEKGLKNVRGREKAALRERLAEHLDADVLAGERRRVDQAETGVPVGEDGSVQGSETHGEESLGEEISSRGEELPREKISSQAEEHLQSGGDNESLASSEAEDFDETFFNEYEFANRDFIIKYEKEQGYR